jgi:DNA-damage-inducible protein D
MTKQSDKLAEVYAMLETRNQEFHSLDDAKRVDSNGVELWELEQLRQLLGYGEGESLDPALNRAKITLSKAKINLADNVISGESLGCPGQTFITKYAAILIVFNADVEKEEVATAQAYFALILDKQALEDEKRIRTRFEVNDENRRLAGAAKSSGVVDFAKFHGAGISALYGGLSVDRIKVKKGLTKSQQLLDFAGSDELAANLFRITQTRAALERQQQASESLATGTHKSIGANIRRTIIEAGNTPPEDLPPAKESINKVATRKRKELKK